MSGRMWRSRLLGRNPVADKVTDAMVRAGRDAVRGVHLDDAIVTAIYLAMRDAEERDGAVSEAPFAVPAFPVKHFVARDE